MWLRLLTDFKHVNLLIMKKIQDNAHNNLDYSLSSEMLPTQVASSDCSSVLSSSWA